MQLDPNNYEWCHDWKEIVKTIEVTFTNKRGDDVTVRIEAIKSNNPNNLFYTRETVVGAQDPGRWEFPWTSGSSADEVINRSLAFLHEHAKEPVAK